MRIITKQQFVEIAGKEYGPDSHYHPTLDADGDRVISEEEVEQTVNPDFEWVKELPFKEWKKVIINSK